MRPGEIAMAVTGLGLAALSCWGFYHFWTVVMLPGAP